MSMNGLSLTVMSFTIVFLFHGVGGGLYSGTVLFRQVCFVKSSGFWQLYWHWIIPNNEDFFNNIFPIGLGNVDLGHLFHLCSVCFHLCNGT